jgi:hypothetical protein
MEVNWKLFAAASLSPGIESSESIIQEVGWAPEAVWTCGEHIHTCFYQESNPGHLALDSLFIFRTSNLSLRECKIKNHK